MKLPEKERQAHRDAFRAMSLPEKADYIFSYYKLPIVLAIIACVAVGSALYGWLTYKEPVLYLGFTNVAISDEKSAALTDGYLEAAGFDDRSKYGVTRYLDLYLASTETSVDTRFSYASRLKLLASIEAQKLDVVIMDSVAFETMRQSGFLLDLGDGVYAIEGTKLPALANIGYGEALVGIIANTPRQAEARRFLDYLAK